MTSINSAINSFDNVISVFTEKYIRKPQIVYGILVLFVILYSSQIAPMLPGSISRVFQSSFFKLFVFIMILWVAHVSPSLSIIIAVVFLLSTNYLNNKKLWESLDNTNTVDTPLLNTSSPTPVDSVNAVNNLTIQAMTPEAGAPDAVQNAVNVASANINQNDTASLQAIQTLQKAATSSTTGNLPEIQSAMNTIVQGINDNLPNTTSPSAAVKAIQVLANNAATPGPASNTVIMTAANTAITAMPTNNVIAMDAIQSLAVQAVTPKPIDNATLTQMTQVAIQGITSNNVSDTGCYPTRQFDMSKVEASIDNRNNEDYQAFVPSM